MSTVPFYSFGPQHKLIEDEMLGALKRVVASNYFINGPEVEAFEREYADFCGRKYCVGVGNGLDAITLTLKALDLDPTKKVVTVANSFIASALGASYAGYSVDLVDCGEDYLWDTTALERLIPKDVACLLPVHLYGLMADMSALSRWANQYGIKVIEDAAQAQGSRRDGQSVGTLSAAATFSFYPGKNLGALGDAGAVVTDDQNLAQKIKKLRSYGSTVKYHHDLKGCNSRLDEIQAAVLRVKLRHLAKFNTERVGLAKFYDDHLGDIPAIHTPVRPPNTDHIYHQYVIACENRDALQAHLKSRGIETLIHYPIAIHKSEAYAKELGHIRVPRTERYAQQILSLPIWPGLSQAQQELVVREIKNFLSPKV